MGIGASMDRYTKLNEYMGLIVEDFKILAGDKIGPNVAWQDVAGTLSVNLQCLAKFLDVLRTGETHWQGCPLTGPIDFPSLAYVVERSVL